MSGHLSLRCKAWNEWNAGRQGHCAVWAYPTPWGALWGAWRLHRTRKWMRTT